MFLPEKMLKKLAFQCQPDIWDTLLSLEVSYVEPFSRIKYFMEPHSCVWVGNTGKVKKGNVGRTLFSFASR